MADDEPSVTSATELERVDDVQDAADAAEQPDNDRDAGIDEQQPEDGHEDGATGEPEAPLDEQVYKLKSHKRKTAAKPRGPKEQRRVRAKRRAAESEPDYAKTTELPDDGDAPEEEELDEATLERRNIEAKLDAALKKPGGKRRKLAGDDLEQLQDEKIARLREEMREAALLDAECVENGKPALNKIKMLPEVVSVLNKHSLADSILDGNLLESVRIWLEPLPDASLPSYEIQKELFAALERLPIKTIHLRDSKLGQVVLFYQKSKRPHVQIKRIADKLVGDWTRPIMGRSDNYRDKQVVTRVYDPLSDLNVRSKSRESLSLAEESAIRRNRAAIPTARGETYSVAPMSNVNAAAGARPSADSQLRRMKTKLLSSKSQSTRKSKVSVEGRGLN